MAKESEFGGGPGMYQTGAEAAGFDNLPDPTGIRDVWAMYATNPADVDADPEDLTKIAVQAPAFASGDEEL